METQKVLCPYCGSEMEPGRLRSRGLNHFLPDGSKVPWFLTKRACEKTGTIPLPPSPVERFIIRNEDYPRAYHCRNCKKIIIAYE